MTVVDTRLPADAVSALAASIAASRLRSLSLQRVAAPLDALHALPDAFAAAGAVVALTHVDICSTPIGDKGVTALVRAWTARRWSLRLLRLRHVECNATGLLSLLSFMRSAADSLVAGYSNNSANNNASPLASLLSLDIGGATFDARCNSLLGELLVKLSLRELRLDDNTNLDVDIVSFGLAAGAGREILVFVCRVFNDLIIIYYYFKKSLFTGGIELRELDLSASMTSSSVAALALSSSVKVSRRSPPSLRYVAQLVQVMRTVISAHMNRVNFVHFVLTWYCHFVVVVKLFAFVARCRSRFAVRRRRLAHHRLAYHSTRPIRRRSSERIVCRCRRRSAHGALASHVAYRWCSDVAHARGRYRCAAH